MTRSPASRGTASMCPLRVCYFRGCEQCSQPPGPSRVGSAVDDGRLRPAETGTASVCLAASITGRNGLDRRGTTLPPSTSEPLRKSTFPWLIAVDVEQVVDEDATSWPSWPLDDAARSRTAGLASFVAAWILPKRVSNRRERIAKIVRGALARITPSCPVGVGRSDTPRPWRAVTSLHDGDRR